MLPPSVAQDPHVEPWLELDADTVDEQRVNEYAFVWWPTGTRAFRSLSRSPGGIGREPL